MYRTRKIRLLLKEHQKQCLLTYTALYHKQILSIVQQLQQNPLQTYRNLYFEQTIPKESRWYCYRSAKCFLESNHKKIAHIYECSIKWNPANISLQNKLLIITLHNKTLSIMLSEEVNMENFQVQRIDIVHDEMFWYLNVLLHQKDSLSNKNMIR